MKQYHLESTVNTITCLHSNILSSIVEQYIHQFTHMRDPVHTTHEYYE